MSEAAWKNVIRSLEPIVGRPNFVTWLKPTRFVENREGLVIIAVPSLYTRNWLEKNLRKDLLKALQSEGVAAEQVQFEISETVSASTDSLPLLQQSQPNSETPEETVATEPFSTRYNFENFIVGNNNRLAFAAAEIVADRPGEAYNPLFIYGGVGLGKTHLMHAIATEILRRNPKKNIIYTSCETFTSEFIQALQSKTINDFKKKYRSIDVFLVDDIQFLANKEGTQEEFFHTFNILHQANRQIVVTADRMPKEINDLEDRLVSRFGWGMVADIQAPNFENRVAILQDKAQKKGLHVPQESLEYIAKTITTNVRELEGSLIKLVGAAEIEGVPITQAFTERILKDLARSGGSSKTTKQIIKVVAEFFSIETTDILGKKRTKELVYPRQLVMYLLRELLHQSYPQIGNALGGKDHTTIMHGVNKIEKELKHNTTVEADLTAIKLILQ